jgi:hypothetical protein
MWLLNRQWCDLVLWAPALESIGRALTVRRIQRNEEAIDELARRCLTKSPSTSSRKSAMIKLSSLS